MRQLADILRDFRDDQEGSMAIELVLVVPILVWALLSTFVYFDLYRVESNSTRAGLTIADMFSREESAITPAYLDGTLGLLRTLTFEETNPDYRVTAYYYDGDDDRYRVIWSENRGMAPNLTNADLDQLDTLERLPLLSDGGRAILVQTRTEYDAPFSIGLGPFTSANLEDVTFQTFTVIRPRPGRLCYDALPNDPSNAPLC